MWFIYYSPHICMFRYYFLRVLMFSLNENLSQTFWFFYFFIMLIFSSWCHVDFSNFQCLSFTSRLTWLCFFRYVFIFLVFYYSVQMNVSIRIIFSAKVNSLVFNWSLERITYKMNHPWCLSLHPVLLRRFTLEFSDICINALLSNSFLAWCGL